MKTTNLPTTISRRAELLLASLIIGLSVIYQVHCAIHGFDLTDEGYLMSIYQWFGTDINFAKGAGGYPLTSYFGWLLNSWTPGILPMRLWGILIVALTEVIVYLYLRRHFNPYFVLAGLFIQAVMVAGDPKPFGYNTLTAFVGILAIIAMLEGSFRNSYFLLFYGGFALAVNIFIRMPNVLGITYTILPACYYAIKESSWQCGKGILQSLFALITMMVSTVLLWYLFPVGIKTQVTEFLTSITTQIDGSSSHSTSNMLLSIVKNYGESILYTMLFTIAILLTAWGLKSRNIGYRIIAFCIAFILLYWPIYLCSDILGHRIFAIVNGIAIAGCIGLLYLSQEPQTRTIALAALLLAIISPLGSDRGFVTMWTGPYLALPIGLCGLHLLLTHPFWQFQHKHFPRFSRQQLIFAYSFTCFTLFSIVISKVEFKAYYDPGFKFYKRHSVYDSPLASGVKTDANKADIISQVIKAIRQHSSAGETILVFDSSPLLYYLTETRPFAGISWPCVYFGHRYVHEFQSAVITAEKPPLVVLQYFNSSGAWSDIHSLPFVTLPNNNAESDIMKQCIKSFIQDNSYHEIWTNSYYSILKSDRQKVLTLN